MSAANSAAEQQAADSMATTALSGHVNKESEQRGYDSWIELWVLYESSPTASMCPARYMDVGVARSSFISGWNRAKREHTGN